MENTVARSRWYRLLPVAFITYSLAYLDRANFGFGAASGMAEDLHITPAMSSLLGALFFLGYFFFQVPGAHYASHNSARRLIFWSLILWGGLATATGLVSNVTLLIVIRFMLGVVESAVMPSMLILLSNWFTLPGHNAPGQIQSFFLLIRQGWCVCGYFGDILSVPLGGGVCLCWMECRGWCGHSAGGGW